MSGAIINIVQHFQIGFAAQLFVLLQVVDNAAMAYHLMQEYTLGVILVPDVSSDDVGFAGLDIVGTVSAVEVCAKINLDAPGQIQTRFNHLN